jgi:hypothetical protein
VCVLCFVCGVLFCTVYTNLFHVHIHTHTHSHTLTHTHTHSHTHTHTLTHTPTGGDRRQDVSSEKYQKPQRTQYRSLPDPRRYMCCVYCVYCVFCVYYGWCVEGGVVFAVLLTTITMSTITHFSLPTTHYTPPT